MRIKLITQLNKIQTVIISCITLMCIIGTIFIYSASSIFARERHGYEFFFAQKQLIGIFLGTIAFLITIKIPERFIQKLTFIFMLLALGVTAATLIPKLGVKIHGARRWLSLGIITVHPSELLKIAFILYSASILAPSNIGATLNRRIYIHYFFVTAGCGIILLLQPDFGSAVLLALVGTTLLFVSNGDIKFLLGIAGASIPLVVALIVAAPYRLRRIMTFLNPWNDPQGAGFQAVQSLIAIGSGGITGSGIGASKQKLFYLPMQHTDFIFSIIAEETGFIGTMILLTTYITLCLALIRAAVYVNSRYRKLVIVGCTAMIGIQAAFNMGVATGLLPTKGTCLPFVSYGNSALITNFVLIGLVLNALKTDQTEL